VGEGVVVAIPHEDPAGKARLQVVEAVLDAEVARAEHHQLHAPVEQVGFDRTDQQIDALGLHQPADHADQAFSRRQRTLNHRNDSPNEPKQPHNRPLNTGKPRPANEPDWTSSPHPKSLFD